VYAWQCARALAAIMQGRDDEELRSWFPDSFRITARRMEVRFQGRRHVVGTELEKSK
jgi:hypothetical protein